MGFVDSYKRLEKLCGDLLNDDRRVSAYIDEMIRMQNGAYHIRGWDADLKQLKHYRWVRNKIVHEPNCTEENMCEPGDTQWLDDFYDRIMNRTDPLALYYKAIKAQASSQPTQPLRTNPQPVFQNRRNPKPWLAGAALLVGALSLAIVIILISKL